jgi:hypothetical protein
MSTILLIVGCVVLLAVMTVLCLVIYRQIEAARTRRLFERVDQAMSAEMDLVVADIARQYREIQKAEATDDR